MMENKEIVVLLGSTSSLKVRAVKESFEEMFASSKISIHSVNAASEINAQPFGNEETVKGATNRLKNAISQKPTHLQIDYVVAIENGIFPITVSDQTRFMDVGWVIVQEMSSGKQGISHSCGIEFLSEHVEEARQRGFETTVVGDIMVARLSNQKLVSNDPHLWLTNGTSRVQLLKEPIHTAVQQIIQFKKIQ